MAEAIHTGEIRPVNLPNQFPPMPTVARILSRFDRDALHGFIAVAIDLADAMDGDPEAEANGTEDDFVLAWWQQRNGPGCALSDPDFGVDDKGEQTRDEDDWFTHPGTGPGCPLADSGIAEDGLVEF